MYDYEDEHEIGDRFSDLSLLLDATKPEGYDEYYNTRSPLIGKEVSIGYLKEKTDMFGNDIMVWAILEMFCEGQSDLGWDLMLWYQNDIKTSTSIEAKLLDRITSKEIRYTTTQTLHEYNQPEKQQPAKRGMFGLGRRRGAGRSGGPE
jgi:hypothetical protein